MALDLTFRFTTVRVFLLFILIFSSQVEARRFDYIDWALVDRGEFEVVKEWWNRSVEGENAHFPKTMAMGWEWVGVEGEYAVFKDEFGETKKTSTWLYDDLFPPLVTDKEGHVIALIDFSNREFNLNYYQKFPYLKYIHLQTKVDIDMADFDLPKGLEVLVIAYGGGAKIGSLSRLKKNASLLALTLAGIGEEIEEVPNIPSLKSLKIQPDSPIDKPSPVTSKALLKVLKRNPQLEALALTLVEIDKQSLGKLPGLLPNVTALDLHITIDDEPLTDFSIFSSLGGLRLLSLPTSDLRSLNRLPDMPDLEVLRLINTGLTSLDGIERFPKLKELNVQSNKIISMKPLEALSNLEVLNLQGASMTSLVGLRNNKNLRHLDLDFVHFKSLAPLSSLSNLETLLLSSAEIENFHGLEKLSKLKTIEFTGAMVTNVDGLPNPSSLEKLELIFRGKTLHEKVKLDGLLSQHYLHDIFTSRAERNTLNDSIREELYVHIQKNRADHEKREAALWDKRKALYKTLKSQKLARASNKMEIAND